MPPRSATSKELAVEVLVKVKNFIAAILARVLPGPDESALRRILVIDDRVPHPDLGAGFPRSNIILWELTRLGYDVTFYPVTFPHESEETARQDLPPKTTLALGHGAYGLRKFLAERHGQYGLILVSRPYNMDVLRHMLPITGRPKIIYDAEALFCMREIEKRRIEGQPLSPRVEQEMISSETKLAAGSNCIVTVSESERSKFVAQGFKRVFTLSHAVESQPTPAAFDQRKNFLFVGPVDDLTLPNALAVNWFAREVLPLIHEQLNERVRLVIAGRHTAEVIDAVGGEVEFLGRVEDLTATYNSARVFVAPARFAAGIPLKIIEAAAFGLPIVGTTLMATQLGWQDRAEMLTASTAEEFAAACVHVYTNGALWNDLRAKALERVQADYSPAAFSEKLRSVVKEARDS